MQERVVMRRDYQKQLPAKSSSVSPSRRHSYSLV
jgi:hypothetical protein